MQWYTRMNKDLRKAGKTISKISNTCNDWFRKQWKAVTEVTTNLLIPNKVAVEVKPAQDEQAQVEKKAEDIQVVEADNAAQEQDNKAIKKALGEEFYVQGDELKVEDNELKLEDGTDAKITIEKNNNKYNIYNISQGLRVDNRKQGHFVKMLNVKVSDVLNKDILLKNVTYNLGTYRNNEKHGVHITIKPSKIKDSDQPQIFNNYYRNGVIVLLNNAPKQQAPKGNFVAIDIKKVKNANKVVNVIKSNDATLTNLNNIKNENRQKQKEFIDLIQNAQLKRLQKSERQAQSAISTSFAYKVLSQMPGYMMSHQEVRDRKNFINRKRTKHKIRHVLVCNKARNFTNAR